MYAIGANTRTPIFQLNDHIGFDGDMVAEDGTVVKGDGQGIDGKIFSREFFEVDSSNPDLIRVFVNSMGGDVQQGIDIFTSIAHAKSKTKATIAGFAYSSSGWAPLAADIVEMTTNSRWMCHLPYNPENPEEKSEFLDSVIDIISTTIADKSGRNGEPKKTKEQVLQMMKNKTYLTAEQMLKEGLIDKVISPSGKLVKQQTVNIDSKDAIYFYKESQKCLNSFLKNTSMSYKRVVNRLNAMKNMSIDLAEDSGEDEIIASLVKVENKLRANNEEMMDMQKTLDTANSESMDRKARLEEMKSKADDAENSSKVAKAAYDKMCIDFENMEADNKILKEKVSNFEKITSDATLEAKKLAAKNLVKEHEMKFGYAENAEKKAEIEAAWEKRAVDNYEDTKLILEAMGVKMSAPRPSLGTTPPSLKTEIPVKNGDVMKYMAQEQAKKLASNIEKRTPATFSK